MQVVQEMRAPLFPRPFLATVLLVGAAVPGPEPLFAGDAGAGRRPSTVPARSQRYTRTVSEYAIPDVTLVDQAGRKVALNELLGADKPIALNFFFASCGSICPVMTSTFSQMRKELGHDGDGLRVVSVTIDPDQDTPETLRAYAKRFSAGEGWSFLTGDAEKILDVQKAFFADSGGKFNHKLLYFFRAAGSKSWVRVEGLANAADLVGEVRSLGAAKPAKSDPEPSRRASGAARVAGAAFVVCLASGAVGRGAPSPPSVPRRRARRSTVPECFRRERRCARSSPGTFPWRDPLRRARRAISGAA